MKPQSTIFCPLCMGNFTPDQKTVIKSFESYEKITVHAHCWKVIEKMPKPEIQEPAKDSYVHLLAEIEALGATYTQNLNSQPITVTYQGRTIYTGFDNHAALSATRAAAEQPEICHLCKKPIEAPEKPSLWSYWSFERVPIHSRCINEVAGDDAIYKEFKGYKYNYHGVCVEGAELHTLQGNKKETCEIEVAECEYGWAFGYDINYRDGGGCGPLMGYHRPINNSSKNFFPTKTEALIAGFTFAKSRFWKSDRPSARIKQNIELKLEELHQAQTETATAHAAQLQPATPSGTEDIGQPKTATVMRSDNQLLNQVDLEETEIGGYSCISNGNYLGAQVTPGTHVKQLLADPPKGIIPQAAGQQPEKVCCYSCAGPLFPWENIILLNGARGEAPAHIECWKGTRKPPRPYPGNKGADGTYHRIINHFPPHHTYIELFAGSGKILEKKKPAEVNIAVERSREVISAYAGQWPQDTEVVNGCAFDFLRENTFLRPGILIYLDPPYPMASRRGQRDLYIHELSDDEHRQLLALLLPLRSMVAISSYANPIYDEMLKGWNRFDFEVQTRGGTATESLYMNYPEPTELHQYDLLGTDKTERQRIKRKVNRWADGLKRLPPLERNAILETLKTELL